GEIKAQGEWTPIRLLILRDKEPVAAISILQRSVPMGKTIFYATRGPVVDIEDKDAVNFLMEQVAKIAKERKAIYLKLDPDVSSDEAWQRFFKDYGFIRPGSGSGFEGIQPRYVFRLDITPDEDILMKNMHQKTRYNLRLAGKRGVTIEVAEDKSKLREFYDLLKVTAERDDFLIRSYKYFEDMYDYLVPRGYGQLFYAYYEGEMIAGTFYLQFGSKAWYLYGASSNEHRNVMPNYLIQWTMIQYAKEHGCTLYDFRGVPGEVPGDHPLYGLYKFKKGFNGDYVEFIGEYDLIYNKVFYKLYEVFEPLYYKGVRKLLALKKKLKGAGGK
ncbi:MAG: peptidoglycan bridge formation glycyltransferase FemA/FemB family protein, partial [Bacillota bacterium]|nr:peptidoglycan bridge formation glycyltransferase FemA/FemB family protein [Bacillota bacterium]